MKLLHREDLFGWSVFNEERDIDFHRVLWVRREGNIAVDPLPLSPHDRDHLMRLGSLEWIVVTNSDHLRASLELARLTGAKLAGPRGEQGSFGIPCQRWLGDGDEVVPGLRVLELHGSKTPGERALWRGSHQKP